MIIASIALILTSVIVLCAVVGHEIQLVATELGNSLRVHVAGVLGHRGRHVAGRRRVARHGLRVATL